MADTDLIACLYSADDAGVGYSSRAIAMNTSRYAPPLLTLPSPKQRFRGDRESTEPAEEAEVDVNLYRSRLELRFSRGPQTDAGLVFGWDRNSDIVLPQVPGISFHHCTLTFDAANRPLIKDLGSQGGTAVSYDAEAGDQIRRDFAWIIGGHEVPQGKKTTVIHFSRHLRLQIVVTGHELASPTYIENVRRFRLGTSDPEKLLGRLDLTSRPRTRPASGAGTPSSGPVVLRKILGEGGFGTVSHAWDVTTGEEYALKEPSSKARQNIDGLLRVWTKEGAIMERISHSRQWDSIHVKLADFGIHKDSFDLTTIVGTRYYTAPEIFIESDRRIYDDATPKKGFTAAIDLWSLGVVLGQYVVPLPRCDAAGLAWCRTIIDVIKKSLEEKPSEFKKLIATLLAWNPSDRGSAMDCYRRALCLPQETEEDSSFTTVTTETADSRAAYSQSEYDLCNSPMLCYVNRSQLSAMRNIRPPTDQEAAVNWPVFRLQKAKAKRTIPEIPDHDVQFAAIFLAMAQRHFYPTPPASSTRDSFWTTNLPGTPIPRPNLDNITLHILTEGDDVLIVYKGHVTRKFLERFHNPFAAPRDEEGLVCGMHIEYTRVSMKPYLDPQDLGRALGDIIIRYQYPTKETSHYDAVDNGILNEESNCKRRRQREGPDVQCDEHPVGVKKRCLR
ncbi:Endonuclease/exonuclease/phosphatase [Purpureocillium lavendulum]|uniref:non-specific serine/threonine protein kinase n=1 Tax=Purpureocillium lavendulum TaxID=1247861 RepID=A0AB34FD01_9HYPO|nr:Endonuclease/exonuclease/phosphatase [Purpureocillium lavendulum]